MLYQKILAKKIESKDITIIHYNPNHNSNIKYFRMIPDVNEGDFEGDPGLARQIFDLAIPGKL